MAFREESILSHALPKRGDPDPYPNYSWLREHAPVSSMFSPHGVGPTWFVTSYELAKACLGDPRLSNDDRNSSQYAGDEDENRDTARGLLGLDRPEHARLRKMVTSAFSPSAVERLRPMMERVCHTLIDGFADRDRVDLVAEYALPVPVAIIHEVLGIPASHRKPPARCLDLFYRAGMVKPPDREPFEELIEYVDQFAEYKRAHPGDDVTTVLLGEMERGHLQGQKELRSMLLAVLGAGHVTTVQFLATGVLRLLQHPDQLANLLSGAVSWQNSVGEMLRYDAAVQATEYRYATEDMEIGGTQVSKGDALLISVGAANRDPARFTCPEEFRLDRPARSNLAFGHGPHLCLGAHLARVEGEVALKILFDRLPELKLAVLPEDVVWAYGPMLRGPATLPVTIRP